MDQTNNNRKRKRVRTPTVLQMEATECGAACLAMVLEYYGVIVSLEQLRGECGVSRDGSQAINIVRVARKYGLISKGFKKEPDQVKQLTLPMILFWNFDHFVVLEGMKKDDVYINDPAYGPRVIKYEEFNQSFTGVVLTFEKGPDFHKTGQKRSVFRSLKSRLAGSGTALSYVCLAGLFLVIPGLAIPTFSRIFVDNILIKGMTLWWKALLIGLIMTAVLRSFLTWLQQFYLLRLETRMALSNSASFLHHVLHLPMEFFNQRFAGDIGFRVLLNDKIAALLSGQLATTILNLLMIVFYASLMFYYSVLLALLVLVITSLNILCLHLVSRRRTDINARLQQETGKMVGNAMGGLQIIETLKATGSESDFFEQWSGYYAKVTNAGQKLGVWTQLLNAVPPFLTTSCTIAVLGLGGIEAMNGRMTLGMLVAFQTLMMSFITPVNQIVGLGGVMQEVRADMNRLDDVLRYPQDRFHTHAGNMAGSESDVPEKLLGCLELKQATFGYNTLEPPLIENFNLSVKSGSRVAIVGKTGSGKSTIAKLVANLYAPWSGEILLDGMPLQAIPREIVVNSLAMVDQDIFLFEGTVLDNLTLWDRSLSRAKVIEAAKDACIHETIAERPGGYESLVEEEGRNFSGGQRQRMAIAAALATNPSIVVMDEATSALDPYTEKIVDDNLRRRGCTCLIIAHRLSTIRDCDEIIVLDTGKVVQRGTHEDMKDEPGPYRDLINA